MPLIDAVFVFQPLFFTPCSTAATGAHRVKTFDYNENEKENVCVLPESGETVAVSRMRKPSNPDEASLICLF